MTAGIPKGLRRMVYARDGWRCALCDCTTGITVHHYISRGEGGPNHPHNLVTLCATCHNQIHGMDLVPGGWTQEDIEQAVVEYLADYYADLGQAWNPYLKPGAEPERLDHEPGPDSFIVPLH